MKIYGPCHSTIKTVKSMVFFPTSLSKLPMCLAWNIFFPHIDEYVFKRSAIEIKPYASTFYDVGHTSINSTPISINS